MQRHQAAPATPPADRTGTDPATQPREPPRSNVCELFHEQGEEGKARYYALTALFDTFGGKPALTVQHTCLANA